MIRGRSRGRSATRASRRGGATVSIAGVAQEGETLTATFNDDDPDGAASGITYQWTRDGANIGGATTDEYELLTSDVGSRVRVVVSYTAGGDAKVAKSRRLTITAVNEGAGTVDVTGDAEEGETLTADFNDDDPDGSATGITYQWFRGASPISGATSSTYGVQVADVGSTIKVRVNYTDAQGFSESVMSAPTATVTQTDSGDATVSLSGTAQEGGTVTATFNDDDPDGPATGITYQWVRGASTDISGATSAAYNVQLADIGSTLKCRVAYTDAQGFSESVVSSPTSTVTAVDSGDATASLSGTAVEGNLMTCTFNNDDPDGTASGITYQWKRDSNTTIGGATASTYTLVNADVGHTVKCTVSYTDAQGFSESCTTSSSATVTAIDSGDATATITGTTGEGSLLTCTFNDDDPDGAGSSITYQWYWADGTPAQISGATSSTYTLVTGDVGHTIKCRVNYTDAQGFSESIFSNTTGTVTGGSVTPLAVTYKNKTHTNNQSSSTFTFSSLAFGTASADRNIVVAFAARNNAARTLSSITIGGVTATIHGTAGVLTQQQGLVGIAHALVPSGTTGSIVLTFTGGNWQQDILNGVGIDWWSVVGDLNTTPTDSFSQNSAGAISKNFTIPKGGAAFVIGNPTGDNVNPGVRSEGGVFTKDDNYVQFVSGIWRYAGNKANSDGANSISAQFTGVNWINGGQSVPTLGYAFGANS